MSTLFLRLLEVLRTQHQPSLSLALKQGYHTRPCAICDLLEEAAGSL